MAEPRSTPAEALSLLDVIFGRAPVGLGFHDLQGRFVRINDRLAEINGVPPAEHLGRTLAEILPALPEVDAEVQRVARTGQYEAIHSRTTPGRAGVSPLSSTSVDGRPVRATRCTSASTSGSAGRISASVRPRCSAGGTPLILSLIHI